MTQGMMKPTRKSVVFGPFDPIMEQEFKQGSNPKRPNRQCRFPSHYRLKNNEEKRRDGRKNSSQDAQQQLGSLCLPVSTGKHRASQL